MEEKVSKRNLFIVIMLIVGLFCVEERSVGHEDYDMEVVEDNDSKMDFHSAFKVLNQDLLGEGITQWIDETLKEKIFIYSEAVKGEFAEVQNGNSIFPMELIRKFEEMIYQSLDNSLRKNSWEEIQKGIYFETVEELGANDFEMNLGEIIELFPMLKGYEVENIYDAYKIVSGDKNCEKIFHFHMNENQDNYIFVIDTGGSAGIKSVKLNKRVNDDFILISEFETQNSVYGRVIQFEDEFYYVF